MAYTCLLYHLVWPTDQRRPLLRGDALERACGYIGGIVRNLGGQLVRAGGAEDHVHLVTSVPTTMGVADFVRTLKSNCSRWIRNELPHLSLFRWQESYAAFSVSRSALPDVEAYVAGQAEHHRRMTFQEELLALLARHEVAYDERYIWK